MAKTLMPWSCTSDAAAASVVDSGLEAQSTSSAPPAFSVIARFAVSVVTCRQADRRWPLRGCSRLKRSRICCRTGISCAAHSIMRRPSSASLRSLTSYRCAGMVAILFSSGAIKGNHVDKVTQPYFDVAHIGLNDPAHAEILHRQRAEHRAVHHAPPQHIVIAVSGLPHRAEQCPGEGVAGAGRIAHRLERMGRSQEDTVSREHQRAVLAALDDHHPAAVGADDGGGGRKKSMAGAV